MDWQCEKKCVFNCFLKTTFADSDRVQLAKMYRKTVQIVGAAKLNERLAISVRLLGTSRSDSSDDLSDLTETLS